MIINRWHVCGFSLVCLVLLLDQCTKNKALALLVLNQPQTIGPNFNLTLITNKGIAWGLLSQSVGWVPSLLLVIQVLCILVVLYLLCVVPQRRYACPRAKGRVCSALGLLLGGGLGNLWDRIQYGYVIDFIDLHVGAWHWPAFNIADSALCLGGLMLMVGMPLRSLQGTQ